MAYHQPGWRYRFYEIDPMVVRIAQDPSLFTYLPNHAGDYDVVLGDARLELARETSGSYDVMVMDAFSSDMIPVHLLTREAMATYRKHLGERGIIAFHISNRYLDLAPIVGALADDAGLHAVVLSDDATPEREAEGSTSSTYVFLAVDRATLAYVAEDPRAVWHQPNPAIVRWTDDRCNVLEAIRW
jgi:hypothetical protein